MFDNLTDHKTIHKPLSWKIGDPILLPGPKGTFDEVAVKDPSVVFSGGMWHVFYTARSTTEYTTGYVTAKTLASLQTAPRYELQMIRGKRRYGCAPQVFYYEPQQKWYLVFQTFDDNYQSAFSTTKTISEPETWSKSEPLLHKDTQAKWIDFWIICDQNKAYLFYTQAHRGVMVRMTSVDKFPNGWGKAKLVLDGVHEAVHVYKAQGQDEFHMIYELNKDGIRSFGLATSTELAGPWTKVTDQYATGDHLRYTGKGQGWTDMVSHGEVLRSGFNERLEYNPKDCQWLIQGILKEEIQGPYPTLPWKLGLMMKSR
jgi:hypothetical protein